MKSNNGFSLVELIVSLIVLASTLALFYTILNESKKMPEMVEGFLKQKELESMVQKVFLDKRSCTHSIQGLSIGQDILELKNKHGETILRPVADKADSWGSTTSRLAEAKIKQVYINKTLSSGELAFFDFETLIQTKSSEGQIKSRKVAMSIIASVEDSHGTLRLHACRKAVDDISAIGQCLQGLVLNGFDTNRNPICVPMKRKSESNKAYRCPKFAPLSKKSWGSDPTETCAEDPPSECKGQFYFSPNKKCRYAERYTEDPSDSGLSNSQRIVRCGNFNFAEVDCKEVTGTLPPI